MSMIFGQLVALTIKVLFLKLIPSISVRIWLISKLIFRLYVSIPVSKLRKHYTPVDITL